MKFFRQTVIAAGVLLMLGTAAVAMAHHGGHHHNNNCWQDDRCYQRSNYAAWCHDGVCRYPGAHCWDSDSLFGDIVDERTSPAVQADVLATSGVITEIDGGSITVKGGSGNKYNWVTVNLTDDTYIINGRSGSGKKASDLKEGMEVTVYYSALMTRSLPPQSNAHAVVTGAYDETQGQYIEVDRVKLSADGRYMEIYDADKDLVAVIDEDACSEYAGIRKGDRIVGWYDYTTMSIPARTSMRKAVILPAK